MDVSALRERLGDRVPEDASDDDVIAAAAEALPEQPAEPTEPPAEPEEPAEPETPTEEPVAASAVSLDPEQYQRLQNDARMGREARETQMRSEREQFVDTAVRAGKFPPSRRDHYLQLMERDNDGIRQFIDGLEADVIPLNERGGAPSETGDDTATHTSIMAAAYGIDVAAGKGA